MSETLALKQPRFSLYTLITVLCAAFIVSLLAFPLGRMVWNLLFGASGGGVAEAVAVFSRPWFWPVLFNTLVIVGLSTVFALMIGATLAWVNVRTDAGIGFAGRSGLIFVYTINAVPYVYLIVAAALRNLDPALEEAARVNGAGLLRILRSVSIPAIRPALISSTLLVTITSLGLYSIPGVIGTTARVDVMTTRIVFLLNRDLPPRFGEAQALGMVMLVIVAVLWLIETRARRSGRFATLGGRASSSAKIEMGRWKWPARGLTLLYLASTSIFPVLALLIVSFQSYWTPTVDLSAFSLNNYHQALYLNRMTGTALVNSVFLSSTGALIAMTIAVIVAIYALTRLSAIGTMVDGAVKSSAAIPNLILAVGFLVAFSGAPFFLSGTTLILLLAFIVMYIPPGSIAATSAINQVGKDLREASYMNGAGEGRTVRRIIVPLAFPGFVAGAAIVFVHMMGDLSAAILLAGPSNPVVGFAVMSIWEAGTLWHPRRLFDRALRHQHRRRSGDVRPRPHHPASLSSIPTRSPARSVT